MVAGTLVLARGLVDDAGADARLEGVADQDVVDAQALVLAEGQVAVVPPAPGLGRLLEQAEGVGQAQLQQLLEMIALGHGAVDLVFRAHRVVHVGVGGAML